MDDQAIDAMSAYVIESLPIVARFEAALSSGDRDRLASLTTEDFHVVDRSDYEKKLTLNALFDYIDGCEPAGRMSANGSSITITHMCNGYEYRYVLYNIRDGRLSRIIIGDVPRLMIKRES